MVFEEEIYVLFAERRQDEPQIKIYWIQKQVYALLAHAYQRGIGRTHTFSQKVASKGIISSIEPMIPWFLWIIFQY